MIMFNNPHGYDVDVMLQKQGIEPRIIYSGQFNKEHRKVKSPRKYQTMTNEELNVLIKKGIRVVSISRKLRILVC